MRIVGVARPPRRDGRSERRSLGRLRRGDRVEGQVVRRLAGRLVLLNVTGRRLVAWMQGEAEPGDQLYLEVTSPMPSPCFRRITGGASFWSLPIGRAQPDRLDAVG